MKIIAQRATFFGHSIERRYHTFLPRLSSLTRSLFRPPPSFYDHSFDENQILRDRAPTFSERTNEQTNERQ
jgi:hypothetical protein